MFEHRPADRTARPGETISALLRRVDRIGALDDMGLGAGFLMAFAHERMHVSHPSSVGHCEDSKRFEERQPQLLSRILRYTWASRQSDRSDTGISPSAKIHGSDTCRIQGVDCRGRKISRKGAYSQSEERVCTNASEDHPGVYRMAIFLLSFPQNDIGHKTAGQGAATTV